MINLMNEIKKSWIILDTTFTPATLHETSIHDVFITYGNVHEVLITENE